MTTGTLNLLRYNGSYITIHLDDLEDVIVQYDEALPLDFEESEEITTFIESIKKYDFYEVRLKLIAPVELDEVIGDKIYTLDIGPGVLALIVDKLFYMSHRTIRKLTFMGAADVVSEFGDSIDINGVHMEVGGFSIPYIFDNEFLADEHIPVIRHTLNLVPLEDRAKDGTYFTKYANSKGELLILSDGERNSFIIPIEKGINQFDSLIDLLEFLDITSETSFLEMLNK